MRMLPPAVTVLTVIVEVIVEVIATLYGPLTVLSAVLSVLIIELFHFLSTKPYECDTSPLRIVLMGTLSCRGESHFLRSQSCEKQKWD